MPDTRRPLARPRRHKSISIIIIIPILVPPVHTLPQFLFLWRIHVPFPMTPSRLWRVVDRHLIRSLSREWVVKTAHQNPVVTVGDRVAVGMVRVDLVDCSHCALYVLLVVLAQQKTALATGNVQLDILVDCLAQLVEVYDRFVGLHHGFGLEGHCHGQTLLPRWWICLLRDLAPSEHQCRVLFLFQSIVTACLEHIMLLGCSEDLAVFFYLDKIVRQNLILEKWWRRVRFPLQVRIWFVNSVD